MHNSHCDTDTEVGFLFLDDIDGKDFDVADSSHIDALRKAFQHMGTVTRSEPGTLDGDVMQRIIWENSQSDRAWNTETLQSWTYSWQQGKIDLEHETKILSHLDTAASSVKILDAGRVCLLD